MILNYGSVCSGIEAATVAWHPLGWQPAWFAEIEKFPSALLAHHYPHVPNLGDMIKIRDRVISGEVAAPDVLADAIYLGFHAIGAYRLINGLEYAEIKVINRESGYG